jgi:UDP-N-acetylmuramoyl-tripeptide--D-alanyl-D-alanine ligase
VRLREIARLCGASHMMDDRLAETEPAGFSIDSRAIKNGELFIAIPGEQTDGHRFVREVFEKGACAAIVIHKRLSGGSTQGESARYSGKLLFVENTVCALQQMASRVLAAWHRPVIGITGSAGKTTIKDLTALVLSASGNVLKSLGNLNTGLGLPLTVGRMISGGAKPGDFDFAVLEMGMSSFGEIARLTDIAPPSVGVVGNVGTAHLEFFGTLEAITRAKTEMVDGIITGGTGVLNIDDPFVIRMWDHRADIAVVTFGIETPADVMAREIVSEPDLSGTNFTLVTPDGEAAVRLPLIGRYNVYNALAAAAVAQCFNMPVERIAAQLAAATPPKMRGELIRFGDNTTVIDDSYNSNPQALIQSVRAMIDARGFTRRIVVAGEMLELGDESGELHRQCGGAIAAMKIDRLIGVRGFARELVAGAIASGMTPGQAHFCESTEEAAEKLIAEIVPGDLILVKGSRGVQTERVIEKLRAEYRS